MSHQNTDTVQKKKNTHRQSQILCLAVKYAFNSADIISLVKYNVCYTKYISKEVVFIPSNPILMLFLKNIVRSNGFSKQTLYGEVRAGLKDLRGS